MPLEEEPEQESELEVPEQEPELAVPKIPQSEQQDFEQEYIEPPSLSFESPDEVEV